MSDKIHERISRGEFLGNLLRVAAGDSEHVQEHFVRYTSALTRQVRSILSTRGLIRHSTYRPSTYWPAQKGMSYGFIDGGVANIEIPTSAPVGIRVGSYVVRPGDETDKREEFNFEIAIVDELYGAAAGLYAAEDSDDPFADTMKLRDAARIISESAAALKLAIRETRKVDGILVHGPLINPAAPYGLDQFPPYQERAARSLLSDAIWTGDCDERSFVRLQLEILNRLRATNVPVLGVVERAKAGAHTFFLHLLTYLQSEHVGAPLQARHATRLISHVKAFGLNDTAIFDLVLKEGEYVSPIPVDRQGPDRKWPKHRNLDHWIGQYPKALTTFVKPADSSQPFRLEGFENMKRFDEMVDLVIHTSRLLPSYVFPVGLDIVDRFTKVPAWLSTGIRTRHQIALLRKAIESGDQRVITYAKRVMASTGRDWLFRPTI